MAGVTTGGVRLRSLLSIMAGLCLLAATGCGAQPTSRAAADQSPHDQARIEATEAALLDLGERISGTPLQQAAGAYIGHRMVQEGMSDCLAAAGFDYPKVPFLPEVAAARYRVLDGPANDYPWLAPAGSDYLTRNAQAQAILQRAVNEWMGDPGETASMTEAQKRAYGAALSDCDSEVGSGHERARHPQGRDRLSAALQRVLSDADEAGQSYADGYRDCMGDGGFDVADYSDLRAVIERRIPDLDEIPPPGEPGTPAWARVRSFEQRAIRADAGCRAAGRFAAYAQLRPALERFEVEHAAEIAAVEQGWADLVERAETLPGWDEVSQPA